MNDWFNRVGDDSANAEKRKKRIYQDDTPNDTFTDIPVNSGFRENAPRPRQTPYTEDEDYYKQLLRQMAEEKKQDADFSEGLDFSDIKRQIDSKKAASPVRYSDNEKTGEILPLPPKKRPKRKAKSKIKRVFMSLIAILLVVVLAFGAYAYTIIKTIDYQPDTHKKNEYISSSELHGSDGVYNILVIGTDKREGESSFRSDSMILVSLDKKHKAIKLTSFLRDSWVYIPGKDTHAKLNAACSYGGQQLVIDTIEYNFKVKIDKYVMIDPNVFKTVIKSIGGVKLTITEKEAACITREAGFECKSGTRTVNARTALWYARIRHIDSDFSRTARQRKVIQAVVDKVKKSSPAVLVNMLKEVLPQITTDISSSKLISLGAKALVSYLHYDICEQGIPASGAWSNARINGQDVLQLNLEKNIEILHSFIYDKSVDEIKEKD